MKNVILLISLILSFSLIAQGDIVDFRGGDHGGRSGGRGPSRPNHSPSRAGHRGSDGRGHIGHPAHFRLPPSPRGGWRGHPYYWEGHSYAVWAWGPWAPWWGWAPYYGWRVDLGWYVPEGLRCYADNPYVPGEWTGPVAYYSSDDAINSSLDLCENDPYVMDKNAQDSCRIRNCVRW